MAASYPLLRINGEIGVDGSGHESMTIDRILEFAVALNWKDLTSFDEASSIQVEYHAGSGRSLEYLKCWSSTQRGYLHLVCEYWMKSGPTYRSGVTFNRDIYSADFVLMLDAIMQHQAAFPPSSSDFPDGLIQVSRPSESFINAAQKDMTGTLDSIGALMVRM